MTLFAAILFIPSLVIVLWALRDVVWWLSSSNQKNAQTTPDEIDFEVPTKHAWQRFIARFIDLIICGGFLTILFEYDAEGIFEEVAANDVAISIIGINLCLFYEISCLSSFKKKKKKKIMGIDINFSNTDTMRSAIKRGCLVWYRGMAGGLPFITVFANYAGFKNFKKYGKNSWDISAETELTCKQIHVSRWVFGVLLALGSYLVGLFIIIAERSGVL